MMLKSLIYLSDIIADNVAFVYHQESCKDRQTTAPNISHIPELWNSTGDFQTLSIVMCTF